MCVCVCVCVCDFCNDKGKCISVTRSVTDDDKKGLGQSPAVAMRDMNSVKPQSLPPPPPCVCVCACVRECARARTRTCVCMCVCVRARARACKHK